MADDEMEMEMLIARYLDRQSLEPDEEERLAVGLGNSAKARQALMAQARLAAALVVLDQRGQLVGRLRLPALRLPMVLVVAASAMAACLVIGIALRMTLPRAQSVECARLVIADSGTQVRRGLTVITATPGLVLRHGDRLASPGEVLLDQSGDGTRLDLAGTPDRPAQVTEQAPRRCLLERGTLTVEAAHQPTGDPLRIGTPEAETTIVGTRFRLSTESGKTRLAVSEGQVRLDARTGSGTDSTTVLVGAGAAAAADQGSLPQLLAKTARSTASPPEPPLLPPPCGIVVRIADSAALRHAAEHLLDHSTLWLAPGDYHLDHVLTIHGVHDVELRGAGWDATVLHGPPGSGIAGSGISISASQDIRIADLALGDCANTGIEVSGEGGGRGIHLSGVRLFDCVNNFIQGNTAPPACDEVTLEQCQFLYTRAVPGACPTAFVADPGGRGWRIEQCQFSGLPCPGSLFAIPAAVYVSAGASQTRIVQNTFLDCARGIVIGGDPPARGVAASDALVAENVLCNRPSPGLPRMDTAISIWAAPRIEVIHNTILLQGTFPYAIDVRFPDTTGGRVAGNLSDGGIGARDGASTLISDNRSDAIPAWFIDPARAELHLRPGSPVVDAMPASGGSDWDGLERPVSGRDDLGALRSPR